MEEVMDAAHRRKVPVEPSPSAQGRKRKVGFTLSTTEALSRAHSSALGSKPTT
eukprot:CAMPEP_0197931240 /NCGR_PEP_ID=MMETSP1439-20131203/106770_1 /TAXON_ID=66791 /ORGANISM="Gonyaulax spinifera, Strain CCMP409" /LENGTH=52 /DNA_ID=CAMNT_0043553973 /DNA_START=111 /DNA_END=266 /DNA_ORIENTATION=+